MSSLTPQEVKAILSYQGINSIDDLVTQISATGLNDGAGDIPVATNPVLSSGKTPEQLSSSWVIRIWKLSAFGHIDDLEDIKGGDVLKTSINESGF